ncbi:flavin reductase [Elusimicrobiota bacterium]
MKLTKIDPQELQDNAFKLIGEDWMLITAGNEKSYNTMTASWGGFGVLWHKNVCFCFIRPQRHTFKFVEKSDYFTLSFLDESFKDTLMLCGTKSGKNFDKMSIPNLSPAKTDLGNIYFEQARLMIECKKIYSQDIDPKRFIYSETEKNYEGNDYHRMYIGEITDCISNEN